MMNFRAVYALLSLLVLSIVLPSVSGYEFKTGDHVVYEYVFSGTSTSITGTVREEIVDVINADQVRLRIEATFNDGYVKIEKNVDPRMFIVPVLKADIEGEYQYRNTNVTIIVSVTRVGLDNVVIGGSTYPVRVYAIASSVTFYDLRAGAAMTVNFDGRISVIEGSGVVYLSEGEVTDNAGRMLRAYRLQLVDSNINLAELNIDTAQSSAMLPSVETIALMMSGRSPIPDMLLRNPTQIEANDNNPQLGERSQGSGGQLERALIAMLLGVSSIAVIGIILNIRSRKSSKTITEKKPHWV